MKMLAIGRPRSASDAREAIAPHAREELRVLWQLYGAGTVREMYSPAGPGAILILEVDSPADAESALSTLPLVNNEIIEYELIELRPLSAIQMLFA